MATANAGRKPKPRGLRILEGRHEGVDSGGRKIEPGIEFERSAPEPPEFLDGRALEEWHRVVVELGPLGLLKRADRAALTAYCLAWARLVDARALIVKEGLTVEGLHGDVRNPAVMVEEAASKEIRAWCSEFGLTPAAEAKVSRPEGGTHGGAEANPFE